MPTAMQTASKATHAPQKLVQAYGANQLTKADYVHQMHNSLHQHLFTYPGLLQNSELAEIRLTPDGVVFVQQATGLMFKCSPTDERAMPIDVLNFGRYEPAEIAMAHKLINDGDTVLDIGANMGWYSIGLAHKFEHLSIAAFEPVPATRALLTENIALNLDNLGQGSRIMVQNCALTAPGEPESITMYIAPDCGVNASMKNVAERENAQEVSCPASTLDQWLEEFWVAEAGSELEARVNYIKCDVEGAEWLVMQGARKTLQQYQPIVQLELLRKWAKPYGYHPNTVIEFMQELRYTCCVINPHGQLEAFTLVDETTQATNYFFLPTTKRHLIET
ncbi:MAG: FkbM family methyltransferase [Vampirovibrionales bacterium]|nr:FkbM family methyltransferase [Vampirovibrionales bacterium]